MRGLYEFWQGRNHARLDESTAESVTKHALAEKYGVKMQRIALAWQWAKGVASPIVGATKAQYLDDASNVLNVALTSQDAAYLEDPYLPHRIIGAIDHNPADGVILLDEKRDRFESLQAAPEPACRLSKERHSSAVFAAAALRYTRKRAQTVPASIWQKTFFGAMENR